MSLGLKKDRRFHQGIYKPTNLKKFVGKELPIYRSGLELKFFKFLDNNPNVIQWSSEQFIVPYFDSLTKKNRKYHVDNFVMIKEGEVIKKYLVEIKPFKQTQEPKNTGKRKKAHLLYEQIAYQNNQDKWKFAREYARKYGMEFIIITDKDLK